MELKFFKMDVLPTQDGPYLVELNPFENTRCWVIGFWEVKQKVFTDYMGDLVYTGDVLQWAALPWE